MAEKWFASDESPQGTSTRKLYRMALDNDLIPFLGTRKLKDIDLFVLKRLIGQWKAPGLSRSTVESYLVRVDARGDHLRRQGLEGPGRPQDRQGGLQRVHRARHLHGAPTRGDRRSPVARHRGSVRRPSCPSRPPAAHPVWRGRHPEDQKGVRRIPLWPEAVALLLELHARAFGPDPFAQLRSKDSKLYVLPEYTHRNIQRRGWEPVREEVGLPDHVTFHDLRHCFASLASWRGVPLNVLSNVMGHANVNVTANVYVHLFSREMAEDAFRDAGRETEAI